jgi:hypothetical protein
MDLMELLVQEMDEEDVVEADNLDDYLMEFWKTLPSVESEDPIEDLDFVDGEPFDSVGELLQMTVFHGEYILEDLQLNVQFSKQHLRIDLLSELNVWTTSDFGRKT